MIEKYIIEALLKNGKIVVPGLGTFNTALVSAEVHDSGTLLFPPNNDILFTDDIFDLGSDSLVDYIYQQNDQKIDTAQIESDIELFVKEINNSLAADGQAVIPDLGTFSQSQYGGIEFVRGEEVNMLAESFGLPKLAVRPIVAIDQEEEMVAKTSTTTWMLILIPLIMLSIFLAYIFLNDAAYQKFVAGVLEKEPQSSTLNITTPEVDEPAAETKADSTQVEQGEKTEELPPVKETTRPKEEVTPKTNISSQAEEVIATPTNRFYLIIGSFSTLKRAKTAISEANQKGYPDAKVLANGDQYRVSVADYEAKSKANFALPKAQKDYQGAWILAY